MDKKIEIFSEEIEEIIISDHWHLNCVGESELNIRFQGSAKIVFLKKTLLKDINDYLYEFLTYLELYRPNGGKIDKVEIEYDGQYFDLLYDEYFNQVKFKKNIRLTVDDTLSSYLAVIKSSCATPRKSIFLSA